jgi:hypothetical protein
MLCALKPISPAYLDNPIQVRPGDRLHRLIARLHDSHIDDLTDAAIESLEVMADEFRLTDASGCPLREVQSQALWRQALDAERVADPMEKEQGDA